MYFTEICWGDNAFLLMRNVDIPVKLFTTILYVCGFEIFMLMGTSKSCNAVAILLYQWVLNFDFFIKYSSFQGLENHKNGIYSVINFLPGNYYRFIHGISAGPDTLEAKQGPCGEVLVSVRIHANIDEIRQGALSAACCYSGFVCSGM